MHQHTFAETAFERYRKPTRREQFLDENGPRDPVEGAGSGHPALLPKPDGAGASAGGRGAPAHSFSAT